MTYKAVLAALVLGLAATPALATPDYQEISANCAQNTETQGLYLSKDSGLETDKWRLVLFHPGTQEFKDDKGVRFVAGKCTLRLAGAPQPSEEDRLKDVENRADTIYNSLNNNNDDQRRAQCRARMERSFGASCASSFSCDRARMSAMDRCQ